MSEHTKVDIVGLYRKRLDAVLKEWQQKNPEMVILSVVPTFTDNPKHSNYAQELREVAVISAPTPSPLNDLGQALLMVAHLNRKVGDLESENRGLNEKLIDAENWAQRMEKDTAEAYEKAERCEKAERDYNQLADETADEQKRLAEALARIATLESQKRTEQDVLNFTPVYNELIRQRNENLDRAIKAEARAGADAAKLARVKALLDGAGPVLNELSLMQSFVNELDEDDDYCDWISAKEHRDGAAGEHLPALLSVISEVREVLKGE